jgi:hypothetical protein
MAQLATKIYYASTKNEESFDRLLLKRLMKPYDVTTNIGIKMYPNDIFEAIDACDIFICNITGCQYDPECNDYDNNSDSDNNDEIEQVFGPKMITQYSYAIGRGKIVVCVENIMSPLYDEYTPNDLIDSNKIVTYATLNSDYENECNIECKEDRHSCITDQEKSLFHDVVDNTYNTLINSNMLFE